MKIVMVRLEIEDSELNEAHLQYSKQYNGASAPSDVVAIACDIQAFCYDNGGMHGQFEVLSVEDGPAE